MRVVGLEKTKLFHNLHNTGFPIIAELFKPPRLNQAVVSFSDKFKIKMKPFLSKQNCTALNFQPRSALQNFCKMLSNTMRIFLPILRSPFQSSQSRSIPTPTCIPNKRRKAEVEAQTRSRRKPKSKPKFARGESRNQSVNSLEAKAETKA